MKKLFMRASILLALWSISSCVDDVDSERSSGILSASQNGFTILDTYDLGSLVEVDLSVAKGGLKDPGATVTFVVEQQLLDSLNEANGTSYQLLPSDCYTLENPTFTVRPGGDRHVVGGKLTFDPHKIFSLCGFENMKYVLPFRVTASGVSMNGERTAVLYGFNVKQAIVNLTTAGGNLTVTEGEAEPMILTTEVSFENQWDLSATFASRGEEYVESYNTANGTFFALLPADSYTMGQAAIAKGKGTGQAEIQLKSTVLGPGNYLLPVSIAGLTGQGDASIDYDRESVAVFSVSKMGNPIDRTSWTITANTEEATGEPEGGGCAKHIIDGNIQTYWHSRWQGGEVAPPYDIRLDMGKVNAVSQLGLVARQNALTKMNIEIYAGDDGENWELIGKFYMDGSIKAEQSVAVKACEARYIRLYIPSLDSSSVGHLAELYVYGTDK